MKACLTNRALLRCAGGDGADEQLAHIDACEHCQGRYLRFVRNLETIDHVLRDATPPRAAVPAASHLPPRARWLPITAAVAATVTLVWGIWRLQQAPLPKFVAHSMDQAMDQEEAPEEIAYLLQEDEAPPAFFVEADSQELIVPAPVTDDRYLEAALNESWPCEWQDESLLSTCEYYPIALPFEG